MRLKFIHRLLIVRQPAENITEPQNYSFDQTKNPAITSRVFLPILILLLS